MSKIIKIAEGKENEFELTLTPIKGRANRKLFNPVLAFFLRLSKHNTEQDMLAAALEDENYEDKFLPLVLNPSKDKAIEAALEECTPFDLFMPFFEGLTYLTGLETERSDVREAVKK